MSVTRISHTEEPVIIDMLRFNYIFCSIFSISFLIACLLYIKHKGEKESVTYLFFFTGISLSIFNFIILNFTNHSILNEPTLNESTLEKQFFYFMLSNIIDTCSILIIYFSKIYLNVDSNNIEQIKQETQIICLVFLGLFIFYNFLTCFCTPKKKKVRIEFEPEYGIPAILGIITTYIYCLVGMTLIVWGLRYIKDFFNQPSENIYQ
uniref:Uncharacterized protein n=1 Tax=viral metagenome TaxID=1070528 RepID=A0A6C0DIN6_9ZZZZ